MPKRKEPAKNGVIKAGAAAAADSAGAANAKKPTDEVGGPKGLEPTRYGDWERKGIAVDF